MTPRHKHLLLFAALFLIGATLNFPFAFQSVIWKRGTRPPLSINLSGAAAAAYPYPAPTPADQPPWPPITQYSEWSGKLGHKNISAWTVTPDDPQTSRFSMNVDFYGWPFPVMFDQQMWWPWDDPTWKSKAISDPGMRIHWPGVFLNPLLFAAFIWAVIFVPIFLIRRTRKFIHLRKVRSRHRKGLCPTCAYPIPPNTACPECGHGTAPA